MSRFIYTLYNVVLCLAVVLSSTASAWSSTVVASDPCADPNVRTDVRPDADGPPTKVSVGILMVDLMEINDVKQTLTGDFAVVLSWKDPRLAHLKGCEIPLDDIWSPGLVFTNSGRKFPERPKEAGIGPGGQVQYVQRYYGTFATYHNLQDFPFDKQAFRISLRPIEWSEQDVQLVVDKKITGRRDQLNISNWEIKGVEGAISREYSDAYDKFFSKYDFIISAQRITKYYFWKIILPLFLIVAMSWSVFWINPAHHGPQIGLSATSMLTLIAFIFATTNMVPKLGYLTRLDQFIVGSTVLVFMALLESLITINLVAKEKKELALLMDRVSRIVFPLAFGVIVYTMFIR
jgi:hypothetical protein